MILALDRHLIWFSILINFLLAVILFTQFFYPDLQSYKFSLFLNLFDKASTSYHQITDEELNGFPLDFENATSVFNTVHGSLKQRNSDLSPVGVSFIPAYIPPNTPFYHSTRSSNLPEKFEWIAMDYEFSYDFAHFPRRRRRGPPHGKPPGGKPPPYGKPFESEKSMDTLDDRLPTEKDMYLYTFQNTKALDKLIYLDGASAAKTESGEMDQQMILSQQLDIDGRVNEYEAAGKICDWGKAFGLQGIVRLEIGFEIILCDFHKDIKLISNITLNNVTDLLSFPNEPETKSTDLEKKRSGILDVAEAMAGYEHLQSGEATNIGENRILLDFSKMVSPLNKTWINPDPYYRRINHLSPELKSDILDELCQNLKTPIQPYKKTDWQSISSRMVNKFGPLLLMLNNTLSLFDISENASLETLLQDTAGNLTQFTYNFVRRYSDDTIISLQKKKQNAYSASVKDYVYHTYPVTSKSEILIYSSLHKVHAEIFLIIFDAFEVSKNILVDIYVKDSKSEFSKHESSIRELRFSLINLLENLKWSTFTRCSSICNWDEICYSPTWGPGPFGWGDNEKKWFEYDGNRYKIGKELSCISYKDLLKMLNDI